MAEAILVTGGAGYIGSHVCKLLAQRGYLPVTYDNLSKGHRWAVKWGPLEEGDVRDGPRLAEVIARRRPIAAIHFAGSIEVARSVLEPEFFFDNNVVGSQTLIDALIEAGRPTIIFSSTAAVYGKGEGRPFRENDPLVPVNPYGENKLEVERRLARAESERGLRWIAPRYFNASGADWDVEIGEAHDPETHLIPCALNAAIGAAPALKVFGTDYDTPDGSAVRDYIHVCDLAEAHIRALEHLMAGGECGAFNLGTGCGASVLEVVDCVRRITGADFPVELHPRRAGDPPLLVANVDKANAVLDWRATQSSLEQCVASAWAWHQKAFGKDAATLDVASGA